MLGQASMMINSSERMANMSLTPRRIFDDIHLHIQSVTKRDINGKEGVNIKYQAEKQMN